MFKYKLGLSRTKNGVTTVNIYPIDLFSKDSQNQEIANKYLYEFLVSKPYVKQIDGSKRADKDFTLGIKHELKIELDSSKFHFLLNDLNVINNNGLKALDEYFEFKNAENEYRKIKTIENQTVVSRGASAGKINLNITFSGINREQQALLMNKLVSSYPTSNNYNFVVNTKSGNFDFQSKSKDEVESFKIYLKDEVHKIKFGHSNSKSEEQKNNEHSTTNKDNSDKKQNSTTNDQDNFKNENETAKNENTTSKKEESSLSNEILNKNFTVQVINKLDENASLIINEASKFYGNHKVDFNIFSDENIDIAIDDIKKYLIEKEYVFDVHSFPSSMVKNLHHVTVTVEKSDDIMRVQKEFDKMQYKSTESKISENEKVHQHNKQG